MNTTESSTSAYDNEYLALSPGLRALIAQRFGMAQSYADEKAAQAERAEQARKAREARQSAEIRAAIELNALPLAKVPPCQRAGLLQQRMHVQRLKEWQAAGAHGEPPKAPDIRVLRKYLREF